jgi:copper homeostasis protein (lipoprotein)
MSKIVAVVIASLVLAASPIANSAKAPEAPKPIVLSPLTLYSGVLPCADCPGIAYDLDLRDRNVFFLRAIYKDKTTGKDSATPQYEWGRWTLDKDKLTLATVGERSTKIMFSVVSETTLRKLDTAGGPIQSGLNYDLVRQAAYVPVEPRLRLTGMYMLKDGVGSYTECLTGVALPVAEEGEYADLKTAYGVARKEPGKTVFVEMDGRIAVRAGMESQAQRNTLVVDKVGRFYPLRTCEATANSPF